MAGPLSSVKVVELAGLGPGPYAGQLLADFGAEVVVISRPGQPMMPVENRGKRSVELDLKQPDAVATVLALVERADILIEGYRPGVAERLGLGPADCHAVNPALVYGRMTGWGQTGPWAKVAGHDINYIGLTGALHAMGEAGRPPAPPLNLVGDYGGGSMFLVAGVLAALIAARQTGKGEVVDAAIIDGTLSMFGMMFSLASLGQWTPSRASNMLDGGMPYYRCYATADDRFMAVGCLEPQFFAEMLRILEIDPDDYGDRHDRKQHARQHALLEGVFASRTMANWAALFDGTDACVTPVLTYAEAAEHPQMKARAAVVEPGGLAQPNLAPRFGSHGDIGEPRPHRQGADTAAVLKEIGRG